MRNEQTERATASYFSLSNPQGVEQADIVKLLRRLADNLESKGSADIIDVTFGIDLDENGDYWPRFTVYFD